MTSVILTLNSGSSSIKFSLFSIGKNSNNLGLLCHGELEGIPHRVHFSASNDHDSLGDEILKEGTNFETALRYLLDWIKTNYSQTQLMAVGHRIVHGGPLYSQSVQINQQVLIYLDSLSSLAPLHQPHNLAGVRAIQSLNSAIPQVACFDTAIHHTQPRLATLFALPFRFWGEGVRRYGFHGLSYQHIAEALPKLIGEKSRGRIIVAHLGHGASMCGLKNLESLATTMGLTALDGLPMGTRCGSIDPGVILYLMSEKGYSIQDMIDLLYKKSGLLGLSGVSDDMRDLLALNTFQAREAIEYFCYHVQREVGSLVAALGGLDTFIFTGGIGENAASIRQKICDGLKWLDIELDQERNSLGSPHEPLQISMVDRQPSVWIIPSNEEIVIAQEVLKVLKK